MSAPDAAAPTRRHHASRLLGGSWRPAALLLGLALGSGGAWATGPGAALFEAARAAEREGDVERERQLCEALLADPEAAERNRSTCAARLAWLGERADADGGLDGLSSLEALRRAADMDRAARAEAMEALRQRPGLSRQVDKEAALWLARHHAETLSDPEGTLALTAPFVDQLDGSELTDQLLGALHVSALARLGRTEEAATVEASLARPRSARPQEGLALELRQVRRDRLSTLSQAVLGLFLLVSLPLGARGVWVQGRRPKPRGVVVMGLVALPVLLLVGAWDPSLLPAFAALVGSLAGVHILSAGLLSDLAPGPLRVLARLGAGLASLAALWLVVRAAQLPGYLGL